MRMFVRWAITIGLVVVGTQYFLDYRDWLDWNKKSVYKVSPGPCTTIIQGDASGLVFVDGGSEDLLHIGNNIVVISQGFNFGHRMGHLATLNLTDNKVVRLNISNIPDMAGFMASPHGLTSWTDPKTGQLFIYVVTHPEKEDRIEVFEVSKTLTLTHIKSITDPLFSYMNDLVAVDKDKFYITASLLYRSLGYILLEIVLRMRNGRILYYDGHKAREVDAGYFMPNGINMSPEKSMIYMAESGYKKVYAFKRLENNNLQQIWEYDTGGVVDNIYVDPASGDLWVGSQPVTWKVYYNFYNRTRPSHVFRMKLHDNMVSEMEEIYSDDGTEIKACSSAAYVDGKLILGSVTSQAVVCDVKYLSP